MKNSKTTQDVRAEAIDFIYFSTFKFKFDWGGGLSNLKDELTSVELQHKVSEWR